MKSVVLVVSSCLFIARSSRRWVSSNEALRDKLGWPIDRTSSKDKFDPFRALSSMLLRFRPHPTQIYLRTPPHISTKSQPLAHGRRQSHNLLFMSEGFTDTSFSLSREAVISHEVLTEYDKNYRAVAASKGSIGLGGGITANEWSAQANFEPLVNAVCTLSQEILGRGGRIMLGICAEDASEGVATLKQWVTTLALPRGTLHGMDVDGVPRDMTTFGSVYIKYNSFGTERDPAGTARLDGYAGDYRGVYINIDTDGLFGMYGVLPLDLFSNSSLRSCKSPSEPKPSIGSTPVAQSVKSGFCEDAVRVSLGKVIPALTQLSANISIEELSAETLSLTLRYQGPTKFRRSIEMLLRNDFPELKQVSFIQGQTKEGDMQVPERFASSARRFRSQSLQTSDYGNSFAVLHRQGWVVLNNRSWQLGAVRLQSIRNSMFNPIFNGQSRDEVPQRFMGTSSQWSSHLKELFSDALLDSELLQCSDGSMKQVNDCYALRSLPCHEDGVQAELVGRQPPHSDLPAPSQDFEMKISELRNEDVPLSVMLAIEPGTKLWIFPNGCEDEDEAFLVKLAVGEILVWRGDLVHAGAGYANDHVRVHAYVDPPARYYDRPKGKTNLCRIGD